MRHGGLLGLKYLLAARGEGLQPALLAHIYPRLHSGSVTDPSPLLQFRIWILFGSVADPGSGAFFYPWIRDLGWVKKTGSGIRDKQPGSVYPANLLPNVFFSGDPGPDIDPEKFLCKIRDLIYLIGVGT